MAFEDANPFIALGQMTNPLAAMNAQQTQDVNVAGAQQAQQIQAQQQQAAQQQRAQQYQADVQAAQANPTAASFAALEAKYPEVATALSTAFKTRTEAANTADLTSLAGLVGAIGAGRTDLATQALQQRVDADTAAKRPSGDVSAMLTMAKAGDFAGVRGIASHLIAAMDSPAALNALANPKAVEMAGGSTLHDPSGQTPDYTAPEKADKGKLVKQKDQWGNDKWVRLDEDGNPVEADDSSPAPGLGSGSDRATRNLNPGNLKATPWTQKQPGYKGTDSGGFAVFNTPENGAAAQAALLGNYIDSGVNSVGKIISKWAPSSDGNNTSQYVRTVASAIGVSPGQPITKAMIPKLQAAISHVESGHGAANGMSAAHKPDSDGPFGIDANLRGPAALAAAPPAIQPQVQQLLDGRRLLSSFANTKPLQSQLEALGTMIDPTWNEAVGTERQKATVDLRPAGATGEQIQQIETITNHLFNLAGHSDDLGGVPSSGTPLDVGNSAANWLVNKVKSGSNDKSLIGYRGTVTQMAPEMNKFLSNANATIEGSNKAEQIFSENNGPAGRKAAIANAIELMTGRLEPIASQLSTTFGKPVDPMSLLSPSTRMRLAAVKAWADGSSLPAPSTSGQPKVDPATIAKLRTKYGLSQ